MAVRFKIVPSASSFGAQVIHWYYNLGLVRRVIPDNGREMGRLRRALSRLAAAARFEERPGFEHRLEPAGAAAFRREAFDYAGSFDETLNRSEDTDLGDRG